MLPGLFLTALRAQEPAVEFRSFTDASGRTIVAKPVAFAPATKKLRIQLEDGKAFEISPADLSIEDQVFIKSWIKSTHQMVGKLVMKGTFEPEISNTLRKWSWNPDPDNRYDLEEFQARFVGSVRNMGRETLNGLRLEAATLYYDQIQVYEPGPYLTAFLEETSYEQLYIEFDYDRQRLRFHLESIPVENLSFNRELRLDSEALAFQRRPATGARSRNPRSDLLAGILVRLVAPDGVTLFESAHFLEEPNKPVSWQEVDEAVKKKVDWVEASKYEPYTDVDGNIIQPSPKSTPMVRLNP